MELLKHILFESPGLVYLICGLAELITVAIWQKTRLPRARVMLVVWPLVAVGVGVLAAVVVTDREKVTQAWAEAEQAIHDGNVPALMKHVADDFSSEGLNKKGLEDLAATAARTIRPRNLNFPMAEIDHIDDRRAMVKLVATYGLGRYTSPQTRWDLVFAPQPDGAWRIRSAVCTDPKNLTIQQSVNMSKQVP